MTEITATKKIGEVIHEATCHVNVGENLEAAVELFGADLVYNGFITTARTAARAVMARALECGKTQEEITEIMTTWRPGVKQPRQAADPKLVVKKLIASMSDEERAEYMRELFGEV